MNAVQHALDGVNAISATLARLVAGEESDKPKLYLDQHSDPIPLERVVDSVLREGEGVLHFTERVSVRME